MLDGRQTTFTRHRTNFAICEQNLLKQMCISDSWNIVFNCKEILAEWIYVAYLENRLLFEVWKYYLVVNLWINCFYFCMQLHKILGNKMGKRKNGTLFRVNVLKKLQPKTSYGRFNLVPFQIYAFLIWHFCYFDA